MSKKPRKPTSLEHHITEMQRKLDWLNERSEARRRLRDGNPGKPEMLQAFDAETSKERHRLNI